MARVLTLRLPAHVVKGNVLCLTASLHLRRISTDLPVDLSSMMEEASHHH